MEVAVVVVAVAEAVAGAGVVEAEAGVAEVAAEVGVAAAVVAVVVAAEGEVAAAVAEAGARPEAAEEEPAAGEAAEQAPAGCRARARDQQSGGIDDDAVRRHASADDVVGACRSCVLPDREILAVAKGDRWVALGVQLLGEGDSVRIEHGAVWSEASARHVDKPGGDEGAVATGGNTRIAGQVWRRRSDRDAPGIEDGSFGRDARRVDAARVPVVASVFPRDDEVRTVERRHRERVSVRIVRRDRDPVRIENPAVGPDARTEDAGVAVPGDEVLAATVGDAVSQVAGPCSRS